MGGGSGDGSHFRMAPDTAAFGNHGNSHTLPYTAASYPTLPPAAAAASTVNDASLATSSSFLRTQPFPAAAAAPFIAAVPYLQNMDADDALPDDNPDAEGAFDMDFE